MPLTWKQSKNGWGLTEYRAKGALGEYLAHKTGGRFHGWELTLRRADDRSWSGERVSTCATLKSCKEIAEMREARAV